MKEFIFIKRILILFIIPVLWGCGDSDKLSRSKAEKLIKAFHKFPSDEIEAFEISYTYLGYDMRRSTMEELQKEGFLTYSEYPAGLASGISGDLTDNGAKYAIGSKHPAKTQFGGDDNYTKIVDVKVAKMDFGEITGILEYKESNTAVVNYTYIRKDITPFGKIGFNLKEGKYNYSHTFTKYDDGWRITR
jgi:hypothetical protein